MESAAARQRGWLRCGIGVLLAAAGGRRVPGHRPLAVRLRLPGHRHQLRPWQWNGPVPVRHAEFRARGEGGLQLLAWMPAVLMAFARPAYDAGGMMPKILP